MWLAPADNSSENDHQLSSSAQWLNKYGDLLFKMAYRHVSNQEVAEDIVQETLLAGLKARSGFAGAATEQTWLVGILKNKIMDHFRRSSRTTSLPEPDDVASESSADFILDGPDRGTWQPARRPAKWAVDENDPVEQDEFWQHLNRCLEDLDHRSARAYRLKEVQEIDYQEVCNVLAISPTNLRVMLHRARLQLRRCLEQNWIDSADRNGATG